MSNMTVGPGRPLMFADTKQLAVKMQEYFDSPDVLRNEKNVPIYSLEGLAEHLGCLVETLAEYQQRPEYSGLIKMARQKVLKSVIERQATDKNPAGSIFHGKQMGQSDRTEIDYNLKPARCIDIVLLEAPDDE